VQPEPHERKKAIVQEMVKSGLGFGGTEAFDRAYQDFLSVVREEALAAIQAGELPRKRRFWPFEIWEEQRELFKKFATDAIFFGLFLLSLEGFHRLIGKMSLTEEEIHLLNTFHFYSIYVTLVIFGLDFIIKLLFKVYEDLFGEDKP
jgi:hypothetical protein